MLTHLSVQNFTLVERLDLDFKSGMTVITGETGAGKSVLLEALGQTLGDRADASRVRHGAKRADISATFDLSAIKRAQQWLEKQDLEQDEAPNECLLRRTLTAEGRSKAYINGHPATLAQLKNLGEMLMDIHSQHEHQSLLVKDNHRRLLDEYAAHTALAREVKEAFQAWKAKREWLDERRANADELTERYQLISYQVEELDQLNLQDGELENLEQEQRTLADAENLLQAASQLCELGSDEEMGLQQGIYRALQLLRNLGDKPKLLQEAEQMLAEAQIQIDEALRSAEQFSDGFNLDPERLSQVDQRLSAIYEIARKHRVTPAELIGVHQALADEAAQLGGGDEQLEQLEREVNELEQTYRQLGKKLTQARTKAGLSLSKKVNSHLKQLAMEHAVLTVQLTDRHERPAPHGLEDVELLISTNPGQPAAPLAKVASGGELSRVSLAIQVVAAEHSAIPSLVFDEVDVGIGGATADTVGRLLRQLAARGQILCVTHLAQVASKGHQHLKVAKASSKQKVLTSLVELSGGEKVEELARMLGGAELTAESRAHAEQMLERAG
ncbi:DNA repair protein RecN [Gilvimarinus sp. DA14]|uniref:DNA repair protein RecN n=1 Tax=Gilvimarinus sp. DA14 TaxID=2956798 RepID=UPI0020B78591|nr:DNA repair protein RecN [Gilvimarinus sp. DA14]UTF60254.1 DNA repair protein RecN [Gilvimarinus sp. DA14]